MVSWRTVPKEVAEARFAKKRELKEDEYSPILDALKRGEDVEIDVENSNDLRGKRIALGRRAKRHDMRLEFVAENTTLTVRRRPPQPETAAQTLSRHNGRRKKKSGETTG